MFDTAIYDYIYKGYAFYIISKKRIINSDIYVDFLVDIRIPFNYKITHKHLDNVLSNIKETEDGIRVECDYQKLELAISFQSQYKNLKLVKNHCMKIIDLIDIDTSLI